MRTTPLGKTESKRVVLLYIGAGRNKIKTSEIVGIHRTTLHRWTREDPDFAARFSEAWEKGREKRRFNTWKNHPFRGMRPPTGKGTRSFPKYGARRG